MAEGDTIRRLADRVNAALPGQRLELRTPGRRRPEGRFSDLDGRRFERAEPRGKHLLLCFEGEVGLHSHLGMRGSWLLYRPGERRRPAASAWVELCGAETDLVNYGGSTLRAGPLRRFRRELARLGPDLLAPGFDTAQAAAATRRADPTRRLGDILLDQTVMAGIGNIFKSEACHAAGVSPLLRLAEVTDDELEATISAATAQLRAAVASGERPRAVYRRVGLPCPRCGRRIRSQAQGDAARISYYCPDCQRTA